MTQDSEAVLREAFAKHCAVGSEYGAHDAWPEHFANFRAGYEAALASPTAPAGGGTVDNYVRLRLAGVRDTLVVAANNPAACGGTQGLQHVMRTQASRIANLLDTYPQPAEQAASPPASWDTKALEVAARFTQDTEPQRRASLQCAVLEAMQAASSGEAQRKIPDAKTYLATLKPHPGVATGAWQSGWDACRAYASRAAPPAGPVASLAGGDAWNARIAGYMQGANDHADCRLDQVELKNDAEEDALHCGLTRPTGEDRSAAGEGAK